MAQFRLFLRSALGRGNGDYLRSRTFVSLAQVNGKSVRPWRETATPAFLPQPCVKCGTLINTISHQQQRHQSTSNDFYYNYFSTEWGPVHYAHELLVNVHDVTGLPWWASLALTTVTLRALVTIPLQAHAVTVMTKIKLLQPEIKIIADQLKYEVSLARQKYRWSQKKSRKMFASNMKKQVRQLYIRDNCHPFKSVITVFFQVPMWVSLSFALRNMSGVVPLTRLPSPALTPSLASEGTLWFPSLLASDPTIILPLLLGLVNLAIIEVSVLRPDKVEKRPKFDRYLTGILRGVSVLMVPIAAIMPSCMVWYWLCSSSFGLAQNLLIKSPTFKRAIGIPSVPNESLTPYKDIVISAQMRFTNLKQKFHKNSVKS